MERNNIIDSMGASVLRGSGELEEAHITGKYIAQCFDADGNLKWEDSIDNVVTDVGANLALDTLFGGAQNTAYFLGLISLVGYVSVPVAGHTMAAHGTWVEAGDATNLPRWTTPAADARAAITWAAASGRAKALSAVAQFVISVAGTVKGCFIVTGSGAVATNKNTSGVLYSAGLFSGGDKAVGIGDTLQVSYSTSL